MAVKAIPDGYNTITPYITVEHPEKVMEFLKKAFDGKETYAMRNDKGEVQHAEMKIGSSMLMFGRAHGEWHARPGNFYLYVDDCDAAYKKALAAGSKPLSEPADQFYGDRHGGVTDAEGNNWWVATHIEDVPADELDRRAREWAQKQATAATADKAK
jgi:PhnB protein